MSEKTNAKAPKDLAKESPAPVRPRLFCAADEDLEISVTGYYAKDTGVLAFVLPTAAEQPPENFIAETHTFVFSRVPYNRLNIYRSQALHYKDDGTAGGVDILRLRDFLWSFHLKEWNLKDADGRPVPLEHTPDGMLSDDSRKLLDRLPATLLDTVITLFERKVNIA